MSAQITITIPVWLDMFFAWPVMLYRRWKYGCVFRKIFLGEGLYTIVDLSDYYLLGNFHWCAKRDRRNLYAVRFLNEPDKQATIVSLHRIILNSPPNLLVDHKNGHTLDNRRENLRLATRSQNVHNKCKTQSKTSSKFIGVSFEKRRGRWDVRIRHEGKQIWIGTFDNEIDAAKAYDAAARKYHGEFARLNFPELADSVQRIADRFE
jgi:hypothetical protein